MTPYLDQLAQNFISIPFNRMLGLKLKHLDNAQAIIHLAMKEELVGNFIQGILHGGVISSVLDMAGGMAVMAHVIDKNASLSVEEIKQLLGKCSTINLHIDYLRPGKGEFFIATSYITKSGNKITFVDMSLHDDKKLLIAAAKGAYSHP